MISSHISPVQEPSSFAYHVSSYARISCRIDAVAEKWLKIYYFTRSMFHIEWKWSKSWSTWCLATVARLSSNSFVISLPISSTSSWSRSANLMSSPPFEAYPAIPSNSKSSCTYCGLHHDGTNGAVCANGTQHLRFLSTASGKSVFYVFSVFFTINNFQHELQTLG